MDYGHKESDKMLKDLEKRLQEEYAQAERELAEKVAQYFKAYERKNAVKLAQLNAGQITEKEYFRWKQGQLLIGQRWQEMQTTIATDLHNVNKIAGDMISDHAKDVYALNHNYGTFEVEKGSMVDTSYTLYNRDSVERLMRDNPDILPPPGKRVSQRIAEGKDVLWNKQQVQSVMTQSILQGESIPKIAKRLEGAVGKSYTEDIIKNADQKTAKQIAKELARKNKAAAIRNARTMTTGAENAGRVDAYKRGQEMGVKSQQMWVATLDSRTRHEHRLLDGQKRAVGEPFEIDGEKIRFPGDPTAPPYLVYNCRCGVIAVVKGSKLDKEGIEGLARRDEKLGDMTYDEWKNAKAEPAPEIKTDKIDDAEQVERLRKEVSNKITEKMISDTTPDGVQKEIIKNIENMDEKRLNVLRDSLNNASATWIDDDGTSNYRSGSNNITLYTKKYGDQRPDDEMALTFWHEYGHFADDGYRADSIYTKEIKMGDGSITARGIGTIAGKDYNDASAKDIDAFIKKAGLSDKYEVKQRDVGDTPWLYSKKTGNPIDPQSMDFDDMNTLSGSVINWMHEQSGYTDAVNYLYSLGYPKDPEYTDYMQKYVTPKRHEIKYKEKYKGAENDFVEALKKTSEAQEKWRETHDFTALAQTQQEMIKKATKKEKILGAVTDTFDGGAHGSFTCQVIGGHSASYYMQGNHGRDEAVANVFSSVMSQNDVLEQGMQDLCPNVYNLLRGIILNEKEKK